MPCPSLGPWGRFREGQPPALGHPPTPAGSPARCAENRGAKHTASGSSRADDAFNPPEREPQAPRPGQGGKVPGGAVRPLGRGLQGRVLSGLLDGGGLEWASVAVVSPRDFVVRILGFNLLSGDRVLGATITLREGGGSHTPGPGSGGPQAAGTPRARRGGCHPPSHSSHSPGEV